MGDSFHFFLTRCPRCRATRRLPVSYLGSSVRCRNCKAGFDADDLNMPRLIEPIRYDLEFNETVDKADFQGDSEANRPR